MASRGEGLWRSGSVWRAYGRLLRPANLITAMADSAAGMVAAAAVAGAGTFGVEPLMLLLASASLYGGGVVLNDVHDAEVDAQERPERPIPRGEVSSGNATIVALALFVTGIAAAAQVSTLSALLALLITLFAVAYDTCAKSTTAAPLVLGLCRGLNLLLGVSLVSALAELFVWIAAIPVIYTAALSLMSRGEVSGGSHSRNRLALLLLLLALVLQPLAAGPIPSYALLWALPFLALLALRVLPCFVRATVRPEAGLCRAAVGVGIVGFVLLDAALAAGFGGPLPGAAILSLWPLSGLLARRFPVT